MMTQKMPLSIDRQALIKLQPCVAARTAEPPIQRGSVCFSLLPARHKRVATNGCREKRE